MAVNTQSNNNLAYGLTNALQNLNPLPIVAKRAPSSTDVGEIGQQWIYNDQVWMFTSGATWTELAAAGNTGTFTSLTVNGNSAFNGAITATTLNNTITLDSGTAAVNISNDATNNSINIGTGTGAKLLTLGSATGASSVTINTGSAGLTVPSFSTSGALVCTSAGLVTDATANTAGFVLMSNGSGSAPSFQSINGSETFTSLTVNGASTFNGSIAATSVTGNILLTANLDSTNSYTFTQNARIGSQSITIPVDIAVNAVISIVMTNSFITTLSEPIVCTVTTNSAAGGLLQVQGMVNGSGTLTISAKNVGSATLPSATSNIIVTFMILA